MIKFSKTNWETSFFGGYSKILYDYPEITVDFNIDWQAPTYIINTLGYYKYNKLIKLFLLRTKEFDLTSTLILNPIKSTVRLPHGKLCEKYSLNEKQIKTVITSLIDIDTELGNLFDHYKKTILESELFYIVSSKNDDEGDDEEDNKEDNKEDDKKSVTKILSEIFENIKVYRKKSLMDDNLTGDLKQQTKFITIKKGSNTEYTSDQTLYAKRLVDILDISFDPASDKIKNLKSGKLDVVKLAEVMGGNSNLYYRVEENQTTRPFSVCILGDESGSMMYNNYLRHQRSLMKVLYKAFSEILPSDKIYIYGHTGYDTPDIYVYHDKYNQNFEKTIDNMLDRDVCENYDGPVIESIYDKIRSYTDDNILFISISDGEPAGTDYGGQEAIDDMKRVIEKCKRDGFVTMGIGFDYRGVQQIYNYNCIISDFENDLVKKVSTLVNTVVKTEFQN